MLIKSVLVFCSDVKRTPEHSTKGLCLGELATHDAPAWNRDGLGASLCRPEASASPECGLGGSDRDNSSDELNAKFRSQRLHSSTSSSSSSSAYESARGPGSPESAAKLAGLSRSRSTSKPFPPAAGQQWGASMTLPKVRTPLTPRDSIQLGKKHSSQPQPSLERLHPLSASSDILTSASTSSTLRSTGTAALAFTQAVEETDIDEGLPPSMDGVVEAPGAGPLQDAVSFVGLAEELELLDQDLLKPPPPPLHRFPSWVRRPTKQPP